MIIFMAKLIYVELIGIKEMILSKVHMKSVIFFIFHLFLMSNNIVFDLSIERSELIGDHIFLSKLNKKHRSSIKTI